MGQATTERVSVTGALEGATRLRSIPGGSIGNLIE
jgi:MFS transporter, MHS family, alpha-ketoglutarate permease